MNTKEYNASGFLDELTNPEDDPLDFYEAGMTRPNDPRGWSVDQSDVKATGHDKYLDMALADYLDPSYELTNKDYEDEFDKGRMREAKANEGAKDCDMCDGTGTYTSADGNSFICQGCKGTGKVWDGYDDDQRVQIDTGNGARIILVDST